MDTNPSVWEEMQNWMRGRKLHTFLVVVSIVLTVVVCFSSPQGWVRAVSVVLSFYTLVRFFAFAVSERNQYRRAALKLGDAVHEVADMAWEAIAVHDAAVERETEYENVARKAIEELLAGIAIGEKSLEATADAQRIATIALDEMNRLRADMAADRDLARTNRVLVDKLDQLSPMIDAISGDVKPEAPAKDASNDDWLRWYHHIKDDLGYKMSLKELAREMGLDYGYVRQLNAAYQAEHHN